MESDDELPEGKSLYLRFLNNANSINLKSDPINNVLNSAQSPGSKKFYPSLAVNQLMPCPSLQPGQESKGTPISNFPAFVTSKPSNIAPFIPHNIPKDISLASQGKIKGPPLINLNNSNPVILPTKLVEKPSDKGLVENPLVPLQDKNIPLDINNEGLGAADNSLTNPSGLNSSNAEFSCTPKLAEESGTNSIIQSKQPDV